MLVSRCQGIAAREAGYSRRCHVPTQSGADPGCEGTIESKHDKRCALPRSRASGWFCRMYGYRSSKVTMSFVRQACPGDRGSDQAQRLENDAMAKSTRYRFQPPPLRLSCLPSASHEIPPPIFGGGKGMSISTLFSPPRGTRLRGRCKGRFRGG